MKHIIILLLFLCVGCVNNTSNELDQLFNQFEKISLNAKSINLGQGTNSLDYMFEMQYIDSLIFVNEFPNPQYCMKIVDLRSGNIFPFAEKGKGPGQMAAMNVDYSLDYHNRKLYVSDKKSVYTYSIDSLINNPKLYSSIKHFSLEKMPGHFMRSVISNGKLIGGMIQHQFGIYCMENNVLLEFEKYPKGGPMVWQSFFISHPNKEIVAFFNYLTSGFGVIEFSDINNVNISWVLKGETKLEVENNHNTLKVANSTKQVNGYITATGSENYIYVLYSGQEMNNSSLDALTSTFITDIVYVFDWKGTPIKSYKLDCKVRSIAVDPLDRFIYGASYDGEPSLIFFEI